MTYTIKIEGMGCQHCIDSVTRALKAAGAEVKECVIGQAKVVFNGDKAVLKTAIEDVGFDVVEITGE